MDINTDDTVFQSDEGARKFNSRSKRQFRRKITLTHLLKVICASRETCLEWLKNKGLLPRVLFCPKCSKKMKFEANEEAVDGYIWTCKECAVAPPHLSSRHGSWLESKNAPLVDVLVFTYLWSHGYTEMQICKETNMSLSVVQEWSGLYSTVCEASHQRKRSFEQELGESSCLETTKESAVAAWRRKNKYKDPFIEFLKEADTF